MIFIKPSLGTLTKDFRKNEEPKHFGVDFAISGNVSVKAAANGIVSQSYLSSIYGEVIFILHKINGQTYETVYAHLRKGSRKCKEGDYVKQGQVIGYMGSTGRTIRQHLHFEIHKGRWNKEKSNAVNPLEFIGQEPLLQKESKKVIKIPVGNVTWRVYPLDKDPVKGNEIGFLNPQKFDGLEYNIIGNPQKDVYTIVTSDFGKVNINGAPSTGAKILSY